MHQAESFHSLYIMINTETDQELQNKSIRYIQRGNPK